MRTDRGNETYWTVIDSTGKIVQISRTLRRVLNSEDWTDMSTQALVGSSNQILLKSANKIAVFRLSYTGRLINSVEFPAYGSDCPQTLCDKVLGNFNEDLY